MDQHYNEAFEMLVEVYNFSSSKIRLNDKYDELFQATKEAVIIYEKLKHKTDLRQSKKLRLATADIKEKLGRLLRELVKDLDRVNLYIPNQVPSVYTMRQWG